MYDFQAMHRKEGLISSCSGPKVGGFNVSFRKGERVIIMPPPSPPPSGPRLLGGGGGGLGGTWEGVGV
jgi:ABC-type glycerol-3-phosphate transport system substrate-binding protein